jgi:hypothetical protein
MGGVVEPPGRGEAQPASAAAHTPTRIRIAITGAA